MNSEAYFQQITDMIDSHGWMPQGVFPTREDPDGYGWTYTIGLAMKGLSQLPDLCIVGLHPNVAGSVLNIAAERMASDGVGFHPGQRIKDVIQGGLELECLAVPPQVWGEWFGMGLRYYGSLDMVPVGYLQLVWPDSKGRMPWEGEFDQRYLEVQPLLRDNLT